MALVFVPFHVLVSRPGTHRPPLESANSNESATETHRHADNNDEGAADGRSRGRIEDAPLFHDTALGVINSCVDEVEEDGGAGEDIYEDGTEEGCLEDGQTLGPKHPDIFARQCCDFGWLVGIHVGNRGLV